ncbi:MAG TPA: S8 family serine peptidase [Gammaproteobacteria bacterium]|nr:S8 family serine peptidase [Gammaproteobacteria bacterium]
MAKKPPGRRRAGAGRAGRPAPPRQKPPRRQPERAGQAARPPPPPRPNPPDRQPEGAGRAARPAPPRFDAHDEDAKVAPWEKWTSVALRASRGSKFPVQFTVSGLDDEKNARYSRLITSAAHKYFKIEEPPREDEGPAAYLVETLAADKRSGAVKLLRVVYKELIVQFKPDVDLAERNAILEKSGFRQVDGDFCAKNQWIVRHVRGTAGASLLAAADAFKQFEEVEFAWPHSVAEYRRSSIPPGRGWLTRLGVNDSQGTRSLLQEGKPSVTIAVLDDGVDMVHPNLKSRVVRGAGRDFNFADGEQDFSNPQPKLPAGQDQDCPDGDFHGTLCAGIICSDGTEMGFTGVAPKCKLIGVRIFNGADLVSEVGAVARAINYATDVAHVISCSWGGLRHEAVATAIDGTSRGREGKGSVFVGAAGNDGNVGSIDFPARHSLAIAVGACGPRNQVTTYSNRGNRVDVVAPAGLNVGAGVFSTDVSQPGFGRKTGAGGSFSAQFGSTSAAAAMAAGVAALCLSKNRNLTAAEIRDLLRTTAAKVGVDAGQQVVYNPAGPNGRSPELGSGRIDAAKAVDQA